MKTCMPITEIHNIMEKEFLLNDELIVEIRVKITKMTGIEVYLREFNDEECSDVALVVNSNKFHVSKLVKKFSFSIISSS